MYYILYVTFGFKSSITCTLQQKGQSTLKKHVKQDISILPNDHNQ